MLHCAEPDKSADYRSGRVPDVIAVHEQAAAHYGEALDIFQATNWDLGLVDVNAGLGGVRYGTGDLVGAAAHYGESLERAWQLGCPLLAVGPLLGDGPIGGMKAGAFLSSVWLSA